MTEQWLARVVDGVIWEYRWLSREDIPSHKQEFWLDVQEVVPQYDDRTQVLVGPTESIQVDTVVREWTVRNKTPEELRLGGV